MRLTIKLPLIDPGLVRDQEGPSWRSSELFILFPALARAPLSFSLFVFVLCAKQALGQTLKTSPFFLTAVHHYYYYCASPDYLFFYCFSFFLNSISRRTKREKLQSLFRGILLFSHALRQGCLVVLRMRKTDSEI